MIVVTGATGFLGGALVRRLAREGREVVATGRDPSRGAPLDALPGVRFLRADLADAREADRALAGARQVVHAAALSSPWGPARDFERANLRATENALFAAERAGATRFVYVSTPAVYFDFRERLGVREDDPLPARPVNHYARTKLEGERLTRRAHARGLPTVILRPRALYGPGDRTILPRVVRALERGIFPILDGGRARVDLTYIDDAVEAIVGALERDAALGGTYNVTSGDPQPLLDIVGELADGLGVPRPSRRVSLRRALAAARALELVHAALLPGREPRVTCYALGLLAKTMTLDLTAARRDLAYAPRVSTREGLRRYLASRGAEGGRGE